MLTASLSSQEDNGTHRLPAAPKKKNNTQRKIWDIPTQFRKGFLYMATCEESCPDVGHTQLHVYGKCENTSNHPKPPLKTSFNGVVESISKCEYSKNSYYSKTCFEQWKSIWVTKMIGKIISDRWGAAPLGWQNRMNFSFTWSCTYYSNSFQENERADCGGQRVSTHHVNSSLMLKSTGPL